MSISANAVTKSSKPNAVAGFFVCFGATLAVSVVGALASIRAAEFYQSLTRPTWAPPSWLFGPVWSMLYLGMAIAAWLVWRAPSPQRQGALIAYFVQLALNGLWSWLFFAWHQGLWAFVDIVVLWLLIVVTLVRFWRIYRVAGTLLVPYLLWVSFASMLALSVWQLNPQRL